MKTEIISRNSMDEYTNERSAFEFVVISNTTTYTVKIWQTVESDNNDTQSDDNNEGTQTPAEPSRLSQAAAKAAASVKTYAAKACRRAALLLSLCVVLVLAFSALFGCVAVLLAVFDAFSITGNARFVLSLLVFFGPALELGVNIEYNAMAVVARLFPGSFSGCMPFKIFSFWRRMLRA